MQPGFFQNDSGQQDTLPLSVLSRAGPGASREAASYQCSSSFFLRPFLRRRFRSHFDPQEIRMPCKVAVFRANTSLCQFFLSPVLLSSQPHFPKRARWRLDCFLARRPPQVVSFVSLGLIGSLFPFFERGLGTSTTERRAALLGILIRKM